MKYLIPIFLLLMSASSAQAGLFTDAVEYRDGDAVLEGYIAHDDTLNEKRPGILVVHEWKGLDSYAKKRTEQLAQLGFVAFAVDIYGKGVRPETPEEAGAQAGKYKNDRELLRSRVRAGLDVLAKHPLVDSAQIAAIGYCFGGTAVLELARSGADVKGVVSFHGGLSTPSPGDAANIGGRVLVLHGGSDPHVPPAEVEGFRKEMAAAGVDYEIIAYARAVHGFTNPDNGTENAARGVAYDEEADIKSWMAMRRFFEELFKS